MMRTRLLWFTLGFTSASATMTHFIFRDLWADRLSLSSQLEEKFGVLGTRVSNLESALHDIPNTQQSVPAYAPMWFINMTTITILHLAYGFLLRPLLPKMKGTKYSTIV